MRFDHIDPRFEYAIEFVKGVLQLNWRGEQRRIALDQIHCVLNALFKRTSAEVFF